MMYVCYAMRVYIFEVKMLVNDAFGGRAINSWPYLQVCALHLNFEDMERMHFKLENNIR